MVLGFANSFYRPAFDAADSIQVLCMSTIDLLAARRFAERLGAKGVVMLDAALVGSGMDWR
jgi:3-hydroxyisobutyrate dehydrogenase-like beta-hydroxyacid dehydrogenase